MQCFFLLFFPRWRLSVGLLNGLLTYLLKGRYGSFRLWMNVWVCR